MFSLKFGGILNCFEGDLPLKGLLRLKENCRYFYLKVSDRSELKYCQESSLILI
jgi:hypothetical protein